MEAAVLLAGLGAIAWIAITNRRAWAQHDADFGTGDNTDMYYSVMRDMYRNGGYAGDGGGDGGSGHCGGGGDGGGCHE